MRLPVKSCGEVGHLQSHHEIIEALEMDLSQSYLVPLKWPGCRSNRSAILVLTPPRVLLIVVLVFFVLVCAPPSTFLRILPPVFLIRQLIAEDWKYRAALKKVTISIFQNCLR